MPGVICLSAAPFTNYDTAVKQMQELNNQLQNHIADLQHLPLIIICDDSKFTAASMSNFLWVSFTRANPANDIYGIDSFYKNKHWGCNGPLVIDARIKPHHAPPVEKDSAVEKRIDKLFDKGGSLYGCIK
jgi:4-hydroxy-3-polyprenylbenzoate decarboxylase